MISHRAFAAIGLIIVSVAIAGCSDSEHATRVLQQSGYSQIKIGGYSFFGCSEDDTYHTSFTAVGPTGHQVSGVVCSGLFFKGSTIRLD